MGDFSSCRMSDSYSTVGRFLRLASWRMVATVLPLAGLPVDLGLAGMAESQRNSNAKAQRRKEREEGKIINGKIIGSGADLPTDAVRNGVLFDMETDFWLGRKG